MFKKEDKKKLYWLIDQYLLGKINASTFDDEFNICYNLHLDYDTLTFTEEKIFSDLGIVASRFSPYEKDHSDFPNAFYTEEELKEKILEAKEKLRNYWPTELMNT